MPFTNDEMDNIDAAAGGPLCYRLDPTDHRKKVEQALNYADAALEQKGNLPFINGQALLTLRGIARAHLVSLPKPEPKFRVVGVCRLTGKRGESLDNYSRAAAVAAATEWMKTGFYNSVAVEQVSL